jgi:hypothetical protein
VTSKLLQAANQRFNGELSHMHHAQWKKTTAKLWTFFPPRPVSIQPQIGKLWQIVRGSPQWEPTFQTLEKICFNAQSQDDLRRYKT